MSEKPAYSVGDVVRDGEAWRFTLDCGYGGAVDFAFASRKEANVSRRMMKEIVARTAAVLPMDKASAPRVPVSWGELIDKITILEIKRDRIKSEQALRNIRHELSLLQVAVQSVLETGDQIAGLKAQLAGVNENLWRMEELVRDKEMRMEFDPEFVEFARSISKLNDERSALKRAINIRLKSAIIEEKSHRVPSS